MARRLSGDLTPASGARDSKGDMKLGDFLVESKATGQKTMRLEHGWLLKITNEATQIGKKPLLILQFTNDEGKPVGGSWVCMREVEFHEFLEENQK